MPSEIPYCPVCNHKTLLEKQFSWLWFFLTGGAYLFYYWIKPADRCTVCGARLTLSNSRSGFWCCILFFGGMSLVLIIFLFIFTP